MRDRSLGLHVLVGYAMGVFTVAACAGKPLYPWYGLALPPDCYAHGTLLGKPKDPDWPDLALRECQPGDQPNQRGPCVVQLDKDFFEKDRALTKCQNDLAACEHTCPAP